MDSTRRPPPTDCVPEGAWPENLPPDAPADVRLAAGIAKRLKEKVDVLTLRKAEERTGVSRSHINKIINGKTWPSIHIIANLETGLRSTLWGDEHLSKRRYPESSRPHEMVADTKNRLDDWGLVLDVLGCSDESCGHKPLADNAITQFIYYDDIYKETDEVANAMDQRLTSLHVPQSCPFAESAIKYAIWKTLNERRYFATLGEAEQRYRQWETSRTSQ